MSDELFPAEFVTMDSPRLAWMKKHGVRVKRSTHLKAGDAPWCAWFSIDEDPGTGFPANPDLLGYGETEEEAVGALAEESHTPLWNEEAGP